MLETLNQINNEPERAKESGYSSPDISDEEKNIVRDVMKKFYQSKKHRDKGPAKNWVSFYQMYRGSQWPSKRPSWKASDFINFIWQVIQSQVPLQTDARPKFNFIANEPNDIPFANLLDQICESEWTKYNWMMTVQEVILDGYITGAGISSMNYDPKLMYGMGAPVYKSEEPLYCFPDPECNDINDEESQSFFKAYPYPTDRLKAKYPQHAHKIKRDVLDDLVYKNKHDFETKNITINKANDRQMPDMTFGDFNFDEKAYNIDKTMVFEAYLKPDEVLEDATLNDSGEKIYTLRKKYPNGRKIVIASGAILEDGPLPYEDGLIPFSKYVNTADARQFWGISEVEQLASPQNILNKLLSYSIDILLYTSNPVWIVDFEAGVDTDLINNCPGGIIEKTKGSEVRREQGAGVSPGILQMIDRVVSWFNSISGQGEFSQGNTEGGVTAASAIEQLINASRTRIRQRMRNLDGYLTQCGRQWMNRVLQFYTVPRVYRMTNQDGSQYFLKVSFDQVEGEDGSAKRQATIETQDETGNVSEVKTLILNGELDVKVQAGSDLPFDIAEREQKALALFDRQIIDAEEVLNQLQYPNREKILQRLAERQAMAAQQQAAQGG